jgi:hypothetical protein
MARAVWPIAQSLYTPTTSRKPPQVTLGCLTRQVSLPREKARLLLLTYAKRCDTEC